MRPRSAVPLGVVGLGGAALAYAAGYEVRAFRLREVEVPVLRPGAGPLRVLHISDLHLTPNQRAKQQWVRALDRLAPDLVVNTGDSIAHPDAVPALMDALGPLLDRPGAFVLGSNDRFAPVWKNPARYLLPDSGGRQLGQPLPWRDLRASMAATGWADLTNAKALVSVAGCDVELAGVDDSHIHLDRYDAVAGAVDPVADLPLGVLHSPEPAVLDRFVADGYRLLLAGHTHGGQLRVPFYGALVTNCGIDRARARGLSRWAAGVGAAGGPDKAAGVGAAGDPDKAAGGRADVPTGSGADVPTGVRAGAPAVVGPEVPAGSGPDGGAAWLHVSAGLGTSPYAPVRFACPPEATLLTLVASG